MKYTDIEVGKRIREARKKAERSIAWLANMVGCSTQAISQYERGVRAINSDMVKAIAAVLEVPAVYLATGWEGLKDAKKRDSELLHVGTNDLGNGAFTEVYSDGTQEHYNAVDERAEEAFRRKSARDAKKAFEAEKKQQPLSSFDQLNDEGPDKQRASEAEKKKQLLSAFDQLNDEGQAEAIKQVELIAKIPDYRKSNEASS